MSPPLGYGGEKYQWVSMVSMPIFNNAKLEDICTRIAMISEMVLKMESQNVANFFTGPESMEKCNNLSAI